MASLILNRILGVDKKQKKRVKSAITRLKVFLNNTLMSKCYSRTLRRLWYGRVMNFKLGNKSSLQVGFKVATAGNIRIGRNTVINNECKFDNRYPIEIGNNVSITYGTTIFTKGHDIQDADFKTKGAKVVIEDYVWICASATILPGVRLGKGCVVLTNATVTKDVKPYSIVGGNPAVEKGTRQKDLDYELHWDPIVPSFF